MELKDLTGRADLQENGVWVPIHEDFEVKTAYLHRKEPRRWVAKEMARARRKMRNFNREIDSDVSTRITTDALFKFCIKDWRGLTVDGKPMPFSEEEARKLFDAYPTYLDRTVEQAGEIENFGGNLSGEDKAAAGEAEGGVNAATKSGTPVESGVRR